MLIKLANDRIYHFYKLSNKLKFSCYNCDIYSPYNDCEVEMNDGRLLSLCAAMRSYGIKDISRMRFTIFSLYKYRYLWKRRYI